MFIKMTQVNELWIWGHLVCSRLSRGYSGFFSKMLRLLIFGWIVDVASSLIPVRKSTNTTEFPSYDLTSQPKVEDGPNGG